MKKQEKEFEQIVTFIKSSRDAAIGFLNYAAISTYWTVGAYVSMRIKSGVWGDKTVAMLCDYIQTRHPKLKGFGRRQIYNMVAFVTTYSSEAFAALFARLRLDEFVQSPTAQIGIDGKDARKETVIVQSVTAQLGDSSKNIPVAPHFLALTTFTNHTEIMSRCRSLEEKVFYILYAARERLNLRDLRRAIVSQTYDSVMSKEKKVSKALIASYPTAEFMMKDRAFLEFMDLPQKHTEHKLRRGILEHMKEFILELGKDYLYMGNEYHVQIGGHDKRLDLLFYHRGLQCLVDVELKAVPFKPEFISKMDVYLEALDRDVRRQNENPSVGLLLCPSADGCEAKYALDRTMSPIMVAEYRRLLIPEEVMKKSLEEYCAFMKREGVKDDAGASGGAK